MISRLTPALLIGALVCLNACSDNNDENNDDNNAQVTLKSYTINVSAQFGDDAFGCDQSYANVGRGDQTYTPNDARMYVHDVKLIDDAGKEVALRLKVDNAFQTEEVVLLDFEDGTGNCSNGTGATNTKIIGEAPEGTYTGISFKIGVPESLNHQNQATAKSPLNVTGLWWSWKSGYKHLKVDGKTDGIAEGVLLHLGSTMCEGTEPDITCQNANRPQVTLDGWSSDKTVIFDMSKLFEDAHLDADEGGPKGCMSGPTDPDCAPVFRNLGLSFGQNSAEPQRVFSVK